MTDQPLHIARLGDQVLLYRTGSSVPLMVFSAETWEQLVQGCKDGVFGLPEGDD